MRSATSILVLAVLVVLSVLSSSCGGDGSGELTVSAASSLTDAFEELAEGFEADHPGTEVLLNFDSSAALADQIDAGAPVDVFASADAANVAQVAASGRTYGEPVAFATNDLVIVTRPGNEYEVAGPGDLARLVAGGEVIALCAESAPCGRLADELLAGSERGGSGAAGPDESGVTRAPNARATLGAVVRGDAAAAVVYRTDALAAGDSVELVEVAGSPVSTEYLAVTLERGAGDPDLSNAFVEMLTSREGQAVLASGGFR